MLETLDHYLVVDVETNIKNRGENAVGNFAGNPFCPENKIVMLGAQFSDEKSVDIVHNGADGAYINYLIGMARKVEKVILVGFNFKFDLHYLRKDDEDAYDEFLDKFFVWDVQLVEYLLSGQAIKMPSLNSCIEKYGGTLKPDRIKEYWENGVNTEDIPVMELTDYLINDVQQTTRCFLAQMQVALHLYESGINPNIFNFLHSQHEFLLAQQEMEYNGMRFDSNRAEARVKLVSSEILQLSQGLNATMEDQGLTQEANCMSGKQVGIFLGGGALEEIVKVADLDENGFHKRFKSGLKKGQLRYRNKKQTRTFSGILEDSLKVRLPRTDTGAVSTDSSTINTVIKKSTSQMAVHFCVRLLKLRKLTKDINTYYVGYQKFVWPHNQIIHHKLNNTVTQTGRLSSSDPNLQNVSKKELT